MKRNHDLCSCVGKASISLNCIRLAGIGIVALVFLFVFSFFTNPLTRIEGGDAAFFQLVGKGMTEGLLPYRDFFDTKGPYLFLLEYIGQLIYPGRLGCFIIQFISLYFSLFIISKIHRLALGGKHIAFEFLLMLPYLWVAAATFEGGNLTEEFCLPVLLLCTYCYVKYLVLVDHKNHPPIFALVYGAAFGFITLIRITNTASICAIVLCIFVRLCTAKSYKNILLNAGAFIVGFIAAVLPIIVCCIYYGIFDEMLYEVFAFGYLYAAEDGLFEFTLSKIWYYIPVLLPIIICVGSKKRRHFMLDVLVQAAALLLAISLGNIYPHYFTLIIPLMVLSGYILAEVLCEYEFDRRIIKKSIIVIIVCLFSLTPKVVKNGGVFILSLLTDCFVDYHALEIAEQIPEYDKDGVYTWNIASKWYLATEIFPCIKYCDWQEHYIKLSPEIKTEIVQIFDENAPRWVVTKTRDYIPEFMEQIIAVKYQESFMNEEYILYHNKF